MRPRITFRRITSPKGKDFERLWEIYRECFSIRDERETRKDLLDIAKGYKRKEKERYTECYLLSVKVNGRIAGGINFDYAEGRIGGRITGFGTIWYVFIEKGSRMRGLGRALHEECLKTLREKAKERRTKPDLIACELNDEARMKRSDREKDDKVIIDPEERMAFFSNLGYREIDPTRFHYIQPQLTGNRHPCRELMLAIKPTGKNFHNRVSGEYLKQLLWLYTWAGFEGIPGSDMKGHRNPDTDKAYKEMKSELERVRKPLSLKPLVGSPEITIQPLSRKNVGAAVRLLNGIFHYEREIPEVSLHASLNPEPYRKYLNEWDIPELRYWVALSKSGKVIGTVGLYSYNKDRKEANWLGWFCVVPGYRKHGVGMKLLDFAIYNAKLSGKRYLRLYTSMHPNELESHRLYEKKGFVKMREENTPGWKGKKIVYEMELRK